MTTKLFDKVFQYFLKHISQGIPDLEIPPFDPLKLDKLEHETQFTTICCTNVEATFSHFTVKGLDKLELPAIDISGGTIYAATSVKDLKIDGNYTLHGHACILPLSGDSTFNIDIDSLHVHISLEITQRDLSTIVPKVSVEATVQDATVSLNNIRPGLISRRLNSVLHSSFAATVNRKVEQGIAGAMQDGLQKCVDKHAADGLFAALGEAL